MKIITLKAKKHDVLAGILAILMLGYVAAYPSEAVAAARERPLPIYSVDRDQKVCSVSFDAAWGNARVRRTAHGGLRALHGGPEGARARGGGASPLPSAAAAR